MKTALLVFATLMLAVYAYAQTGNIHGQITGLDGKPLAGVTISIDRLNVRQHYEIKSDSHGNYAHTGLGTGFYEVSITYEGRPIKLNVPVRFGEDSRVDFDLRILMPYDRDQSHRVTTVDLTIPRKAHDEWQKAFDAKGDSEKAKKHLEKAIEIAPNFDAALSDLGTIYHRRLQYAQAAELFERALKVNPDSITARVNLAGCLIGLKQYERALSENLRVLALRPLDALAHAQAGLSLFQLRRYEEAIPHFQQARQSDPNSPALPGFYLAQSYDALGKDQSAVNEYEEFLKAYPRDPARSWVESRLRELKSRH
jgi:tetratricopeptide (TPR) repeat protein